MLTWLGWLLGLVFAGALVWVVKSSHQRRKPAAPNPPSTNAVNQQISPPADWLWLAQACHDLRQPTAASSLALSSAQSLATTPQMQAYLDVSLRACDELNRMIQNILDFWEMNTDAPARPMQSVSVLGVFDALRVQFSSSLDVAGDDAVALRFTRRPCHVLGYEPWLIRVLQNLIANALKHACAHRVLVTARQIKGVVYIGVHDNGVGLPGQQRDTSITAFTSQLQNKKARSPIKTSANSYGFGSMIAQRHTRNMGSELRVSSQAGRGTRYVFALPAAPFVATSIPTPTDAASTKANLHVLVLSDNAPLSSALLPMLQAVCSSVTLRGVAEFMRDGVSSAAIDVVVLEDQATYLGATAFALTQLLRSELGSHVSAIWITDPAAAGTPPAALPDATQVLHRPVLASQLAQALNAVAATLKQTPQIA